MFSRRAVSFILAIFLCSLAGSSLATTWEAKLAADINQYIASGGSSPSGLTAFNSKLIFTANGNVSTPGANGLEPWEYDPQTGSAKPLLDINPNGSSNASSYTIFDNKLYFVATSAAYGQELWVYDGQNAPALVADINPGTASGLVANPTVFNQKLFFTASDGSASKLWSYDGQNPPVRVADSPTDTYTAPSRLYAFGGKLYFTGTSAAGAELWAYDGVDYPYLVADINTGAAASTPQAFKEMGGKLYFLATTASAGRELWVYDGANPPSMVADINPGTGNGIPLVMNVPTNFFVYDSNLYFNGADGVNGNKLWVYDGANPPAMVDDASSSAKMTNPGFFALMDGKLYMSGIMSGFSGRQLCSYDGANPPVVIEDPNAGPSGLNPTNLAVLDGTLYFSGSKYLEGTELLSYDGTNPPTVAKDLNIPATPSNPRHLTAFNSKLYFHANNGVNGDELMVYDGVNPPALAYELTDGQMGSYITAPNFGKSFFIFKNKMYFYALLDGTYYSLMAYDGVNPPTEVIYCGAMDFYRDTSIMAEMDGKLYFFAVDGQGGLGVFSYDGVNPPAEVTTSPWISSFSNCVVLNSKMYFTAYDASWQFGFYVFDGVNPPSVVGGYYNLNPSYSGYLAVYNSKVYLQGTDDQGIFSELYEYDGANPPQVAVSINPTYGSYPEELTVMGGRLYFSAYKSAEEGYKLYSFDGTDAVELAGVASSPTSSFQECLTPIGGRLFFNADTLETGTEPWVFDTATQTAQMAADVYPNSNSNPYYYTELGAKIYFSANYPTTGNELFVLIPGNSAPVAQADAFAVARGRTLNGNVLANDADSDGDALKAELVGGVTHGTLTLLDNGSFTYVNDGTGATTDSFTYKAYDGSLFSGVVTASIAVNGDYPGSAPTFSLPSGVYTTTQSLSLGCNVQGASIRYTTNGSTPTATAGTLYTGPFNVYSTQTVKAVAYRSDYLGQSPTASAGYTLKVGQPSFTPSAGVYSSPISVSIKSATFGATVRYTLDGTTPTATAGTLYTGPVVISGSATLKAMGYKPGYSNSNVIGGDFVFVGQTAAAPAFTPASGIYTAEPTISIESATAGASIRYTTDGSAPTQMTGTLYTSPFKIYSTQSIKAMAYKPGAYGQSATVVGGYTLKVGQPSYTPPAGTYATSQSVAIASKTFGATFRYTVDGSTPTELNGTLYTGPVTVGETQTLKAVGFKAGYTNSNAISAAYNFVANQAATPTFNPGGGTYTNDQTVALTSATAGVTIRYTTDWTTPTQTSGTIYTAPLRIGAGTTVKAIAYKAGAYGQSAAATAGYTLKAGQPSLSLAGGTYSGAQVVAITSATTGATIRYTLDGSSPTASTGLIYTGPVTIGSSATLTVKCFKAGYADSNQVSAGYIIN